jgi:predicted O-methyltransferase YrrM
MNDKLWHEVDDYIGRLVEQDDALRAALNENAKAGLAPIQVSPAQGKLLMLLAQVQRARSILEIGTLGAYSTIWLARGLDPDGRLLTLELSQEYAHVAQRNIARAGLVGAIIFCATERVGSSARVAGNFVAEFHEFVFER